MKKGQVKRQKCRNCRNCGKWMKPVKDSITKTYTGYLFHCDCFPKGAVLSIG